MHCNGRTVCPGVQVCVPAGRGAECAGRDGAAECPARLEVDPRQLELAVAVVRLWDLAGPQQVLLRRVQGMFLKTGAAGASGSRAP